MLYLIYSVLFIISFTHSFTVYASAIITSSTKTSLHSTVKLDPQQRCKKPSSSRIIDINKANMSKKTKFIVKKFCKVTKPIQASLVLNANTGKILHKYNHRTSIHPASLTKIMTLYLIFEALKKKKISLNTLMLVSNKAANMQPCKLGLEPGQTISVKNAILALIIRSANDVAVVVAEHLGGTESHFVKMMNRKARILGMKNTTFKNSSGWHHPYQLTNVVDLAKLTLSLKKNFKEYYPLFSKTSFIFKDSLIESHNHITKTYAGAEGIKTGYTASSGFNLITTASRGKASLIGVVIGEKTARKRNAKMIQLLDHYFSKHKSTMLAKNTNQLNTNKYKISLKN